MQPEQPLLQSDAPVTPQQPVADAEPVAQTTAPVTDDVQPIQWQGPEYIEHPRSSMWFIGFWGAVVVLMIGAFFVLRSWSFAILVPVMAAALMIYSHRPPRQINYVLSSKGIYINDQLHPVEEFSSFGVRQDEALPALILIPVKRFRPALTVYFPGELGESIVSLLGGRLPMRELKPDAFDRISRKLRI